MFVNPFFIPGAARPNAELRGECAEGTRAGAKRSGMELQSEEKKMTSPTTYGRTDGQKVTRYYMQIPQLFWHFYDLKSKFTF